LLGPGIALRIDAGSLPAYYFEDIASIQCRTIVKHLRQLDTVLDSRRESARMADRAWREATSGQGGLPPSHATPGLVSPTFWQFVIPVRDVAVARGALFRKGVETGTTNLLDLAQASGVELPRTRELKERRLFVPLHAHLDEGDYRRFFDILREAGQL
jgi:dTDP-4-amino-4,6-dideoxygalactose transaminase